MTMTFKLEEAIRRRRAHRRVVTSPRTKTGIPCTDHLGQQYPSIASMCDCWKIAPQTYTDRIRKGHSIEYSLTHSVKGQR